MHALRRDNQRDLSLLGQTLSDWSVLASFTRFEHNNHEYDLRISRTTDASQSFHPWGEVSRSAGDRDNMYLPEVNPGTILAAFRHWDCGSGAWLLAAHCTSRNRHPESRKSQDRFLLQSQHLGHN